MNPLEDWALDPEVALAEALAEADHRMLRELIALRKRRGLTQQELADHFGISQATVAAFERYDNDPKLSTVRRYAQGVGARIEHGVWLEADGPFPRVTLSSLQDAAGGVRDLAPHEVEELIAGARQLLKALMELPVEDPSVKVLERSASTRLDPRLSKPISPRRSRSVEKVASKYVPRSKAPVATGFEKLLVEMVGV